MIDINKTYRTRDGREVRIYSTDTEGAKKAVHGAIKEKDGWYMLAWSKNGIVSNVDRNLDLVEVRPRHKQTVWVNVYRDDLDVYTAASKKEADENASEDRIACIKVELDFEEGEGL
tara:strand:- start:627 stop:974 length:348 start_codon:yes stop_codon:yes gene_type:complete